MTKIQWLAKKLQEGYKLYKQDKYGGYKPANKQRIINDFTRLLTDREETLKRLNIIDESRIKVLDGVSKRHWSNILKNIKIKYQREGDDRYEWKSGTFNDGINKSNYTRYWLEKGDN